MAYEGQIATIPLGKGGLWTDSPQSEIPSTFLIRADNVSLYEDCLQKDFGSRRWNQTALSSGIKRFKDFWTDPYTQRIVCVLEDGSLYRFTSAFAGAPVTASGGAPATLNVANYISQIAGGLELQGRNRKLFTFTGHDPVQVISGDSTLRTNIANPAADWSGTNQPIGGIVYRNSLFAWGNANDPHRVYKSLATDHEDFTSTPTSYSVYPGEFERIVGAAVFRSNLYLFKYPRGIYVFQDSDPTSSNWYFSKFSDDPAAASPQSMAQVLDDLVVANSYGSLTSLKASLIYGDLTTSDLFHQFKVMRYVDNEMKLAGFPDRSVIYYPKKKTLYVAFQSASGTQNDRLCVIDYKNVQSFYGAPIQAPRISWSNKDQPNCLGLVKDSLLVERPFYGAHDGYLYQMDQTDRWVGTSDTTSRTAYKMDAQTPYLDFGQDNPQLSEAMKSFQFLELEYEPTGDWDVNVDIWIDGKFSETVPFRVNFSKSQLDAFHLGLSTLDDRVPQTLREQIHGQGRRISLRFYNSGTGQNVRLVKAILYYQISGQQQTQA